VADCLASVTAFWSASLGRESATTDRKSTVPSGLERALKWRVQPGGGRQKDCQSDNMQLAFMSQRNNLTSTQFPFYINLFQDIRGLQASFLSTSACGA
jgi:hypothetical protein